ncbi:hypothetical protein ONE63_001299 [Megalurothrips usitatus]|uniref:Ankyrin repeat domain-containing protein n=1 Tax=Megalurothrips usitatus TaxID=439358 RepID=A0AAV7XBP0_9NEOP|nr:hypothetical protein ONE63_001299 [Megalurothrips usitatus]
MDDEGEGLPEYPLHECIFLDNPKLLCTLARKLNVNEQDKHGNTPLHLACMLGRKELVHLLLSHGSSPTIRNSSGWSPLSEAISYGERQTISSILRKVNILSHNRRDSFMPKLAKVLNGMEDFCVNFKWDFQSWVPLVSRILPSDVCRLRKMGSNIRLDTTLVDFDDKRWVRGDLSIFFFGEQPTSHSLAIVDNNMGVFQWIQYSGDSDKNHEEEVDFLMSTDIVNAHISTKHMLFTRLQKGWVFREDKTEMVGKYNADFYTIHGITFKTSKRREHLSKEDVQKNKMVYDWFMRDGPAPDEYGCQPPHRKSLTPPLKSNVSWTEYISAEPGKHPTLGRPVLCKETSKAYRATVAMSPDFPMSVEMLLNVLQAIAPLKHYSRLREIIGVKLPPGFPVQIDVPIIPTISAKVTFLDFQFTNELREEDFRIPVGYLEDRGRFPGL